jgi:hypothetical protein
MNTAQTTIYVRTTHALKRSAKRNKSFFGDANISKQATSSLFEVQFSAEGRLRS